MRHPLTIVHTEASISWGGQGMRILREALWMRERGHRLVIIAPAHSKLGEEAQRAGLETRAIRFAKNTQGRNVFRLIKSLRQIGPDILNTHSSIDTWVGCLAGRWCRVPAIIRTRHLGMPVQPHLLNRWLYGRLCDHIFTTAQGVSKALITHLKLPASHVSTIPTGIQPPEVLPSPAAARQAFIQELQLPPGTRFVGCLAVLRRGKGHTVLLDAFRKIQHHMPHYHLLIIGEGSSRQSLETWIADERLQQRVHLTGHRTDPWSALRALDIKVLASTSHEGTPQAILQAQFAGCPVIGSTSGGITEVITHGETGLLVPKGEAAPLAQALLRLATDREYAARLSRYAYEYVQAHHTAELMGEKILAVYRELLDSPRE